MAAASQPSASRDAGAVGGDRRSTVAGVLVGRLWLAALLRGEGDRAAGGRAAHRPASRAEVARSRRADERRHELADQVLLLGFDGTDAIGRDPSTSCAAHELGGVFVGAATGSTRPRARAGRGAARRRAERRADPAADRRPQEGGRVPVARRPAARRRPSSRSATRARRRPPRTGPSDAAAALRSAGFDLDLFPVADVATLDSPLGRPRLLRRPGARHRADRRGDARAATAPARLRGPALPGPRRCLAGHRPRPGDGRPRRGDARVPRLAPFEAALRRQGCRPWCSRSPSTPPTTR